MQHHLSNIVLICLLSSCIYGYGSLGSDTTICKNKCVILKMPAPGFSDVIWSTGDTTTIFAAGYSFGELTICPSTTDTIWAKVVSASDSVLDIDTIIINVIDQNYPELLDSSYIETCMGDCIKLKGISGGLTYSWSPTNGMDNHTVADPTICVDYLSNDFNVHIISDTTWNCQYDISLHIQTSPKPGAVLSKEMTVCKDSCLELTGPTGGQIYYWINTQGINDTNQQFLSVCPKESTSYIIATITDTTVDCIYSDTIIVNVTDTCSSTETKDIKSNATVKFLYFYDGSNLVIQSLEIFRINHTTTLELFDINGKCIYLSNPSISEFFSGFVLQTEYLPKGMYLMRLFYNNLIFTNKILIER